MPIYSRYSPVGGGGTIYTFVGTAPISVVNIGGTVTTSMTQSDATTDGWLSAVDWNVFNSKQNALTIGDLTSTDITVTGGTGAVIGSGTSLSIVKGNLTELTSNVLTITGGTGAVLGSGTTIQVLQASAAQNGYLSSIDWNTFNNKQAAGNYITALTGDVTATGPGSVTASISGQSGNSGKFLVTNGITVSFDSVVNDAAADIDFRVEGQSDANLLFTDASTNRVGIGNNTPGEKLEISGNVKLVSALLDGSVSGTLTLSAADTTTSYAVKMPSAQGAASTVLQNDGSGNLSWAVASLPVQGAGTAGKFLISDGTNASWDTVVNQPGDATIDFRVAGASDTNLLFTDSSTDSIGIGTNAPAFKLDVVGTIRASATAGVERIIIDSGDTDGKILSFRTGNSPRWAIRSGLVSNTNDDLYFRRYDNTGAFVDAPLEISRSTGAITINDAGSSTVDLIVEGDTDATLLVTDASADSVGIGTNTPGAKLDVRGSVIINEAGGDNDVRIEGVADANLLFTDASTDRVGIGNNTPTVKLDVTGDIKSSADIQSVTQNGGQLAGTRNRIINGAMEIDQRNAGASVSVSTNLYTVDRFYGSANPNGIFSAQRSTNAPSGFVNSTILTVTTARATIASTDVYGFRQEIEGYNVSDLGFGTANAKTITLSFWVRSSITGTYAVSFFNGATFNRSYVETYTISAADTWEYKTITIAGDTTGTWATNNTSGLAVYWDLGSGSNYNGTAGSWAGVGAIRTTGSTDWISTNGATWYLTGVQLELGPVATAFERRNYQQELAMCQRYYEKSFSLEVAPAQNLGAGGAVLTTQAKAGTTTQSLPYYIRYIVPKRAQPGLITTYNPAAANAQIRNYNAGASWTNTTVNQSVASGFAIYGNPPAGTNAGDDAAIHWSADAEL